MIIGPLDELELLLLLPLSPPLALELELEPLPPTLLAVPFE